MKSDKMNKLYDADYAQKYDERFIYDEQYKDSPEFELEILTRLVTISETWLDVGCGTGHFMSKFPNAKRAGLDISKGMLEVAREKNSTALFLEEGDFRVDRPDWNGKWDLVSCMWCAYCYVDSMAEIDKVISNLSNWTSETGVCFLPICDIEDVTYGRAELPHEIPDIEIFGGPSYLNGVIWTYIDKKHDKKHENLLSPHIEYLTRLFRATFDRVETVYYPPFPHPIPGQRKALIGFREKSLNSPVAAEAIEAILEKSREHKSNVLTYQDRMALVSEPQVEKQAIGQDAGWLRRLWRASPQPFRNAVRRMLGER